ncbi:mechanosensitive ion channel family protein [Anaerolineales bacterium]
MRISQLYKPHPLRYVIFMIILLTVILSSTMAQEVTPTSSSKDLPQEVPQRVDVLPVARDEEIEARLQDIYAATGWFMNTEVRVQDGVVFLSGQTQTESFKTWAGDLARKTQDVAAVVNQFEVIEPPILNIDPIMEVLREQGRTFLRSIPLIGFSLIVLVITLLIAQLMIKLSRRYLQTREMNVLLRNVISNSIGVIFFLLGLYLVFQVAGLTNIALTILGGTGLLGLILGIAFRDITENFLASIFLSVQNPFNVGDLVEIENVTGFVQNMTTRTTIVMTLAGNHVQIPNATVYKSIIHNYTSNPNRRIDFIIGIGYDDSISIAQETIYKVLEEHPAILKEPEYLVLVDNLGSATVNLHIYFWLNGAEYSWLKVKSSVIRLTKRAIQDKGISMPDEAREMIFPKGVPVHIVTNDSTLNIPTTIKPPQAPVPEESELVSTHSEGDLSSEAKEIKIQAEQSRPPESEANLLK